MSSSLIDDGSFYERFFHRGKYGMSRGWPHSTTLLYRMRIKADDTSRNILLHKLGYSSLQCERWIKVKNESSVGHAEMIFIQQVNELLDKNQPHIRQVTFDIVLSNSPCSDCAEDLIELKKKNERKWFCAINIKFANFYKHHEYANTCAMMLMVQNQIQLSVFNGLCDWKDFLDNIVKLPLDIQSEAFYETWLDRQDRELVDSILVECIKLAAFKLPIQGNKDQKGVIMEKICKLKSVSSDFEVLGILRLL